MKKSYVISIITILLITLSFFAYNIFSNKQEIVVNKSIAIYLQDENNENNYVLSELNTIPTEGYTFNVEKTNLLCSDATFSYSSNNINVSTTKSVKCNLYFDIEKKNFVNILLKDHGTRCTIGGTCTCTEGNTCMSTTPTPRSGFNVVDTHDYTNTLYSTNATQDDSTVYYFSGNAQDNWVRFGNNGSGTCYYWRIIRTNETGGIRLLYSGSSTTCSGSVPVMTNAYINGTAYYWATSENAYNNSSYVGYKYTLNEQHGNSTDSYAKQIIDSWYVSSGLSNFGSYLDNDVIYCGDRDICTTGTYCGTWRSTGTPHYYYAIRDRIESGNYTYKCNNNLDSFSVNNNQAKLTYPVALITADEASFAGADYNTGGNISHSYLWLASDNTTNAMNDNDWYTMTPYSWDSVHSPNSYCINMLDAHYDSKYNYYLGYIDPGYEKKAAVLRPVISLNANTEILSGNGSVSDPYVIK